MTRPPTGAIRHFHLAIASARYDRETRRGCVSDVKLRRCVPLRSVLRPFGQAQIRYRDVTGIPVRRDRDICGALDCGRSHGCSPAQLVVLVMSRGNTSSGGHARAATWSKAGDQDSTPKPPSQLAATVPPRQRLPGRKENDDLPSMAASPLLWKPPPASILRRRRWQAPAFHRPHRRCGPQAPSGLHQRMRAALARPPPPSGSGMTAAMNSRPSAASPRSPPSRGSAHVRHVRTADTVAHSAIGRRRHREIKVRPGIRSMKRRG